MPQGSAAENGDDQRDFGNPIEGDTRPLPYLAFQCSRDSGAPVGRQWCTRRAPALLEIELSQGRHRDNAIEVMLEFAATSASPCTGIGLQQIRCDLAVL